MDEFIVSKAPSTVYYVPDFVSADEEQYLVGRVETAPKPKWEQLSHRRLQNWGGVFGKKGLIVDAELPDWLKNCVDKICNFAPQLFPNERRPNHVLVNEYLPGQGIMPHTDGPMYHPVVATISLGSHVVLDFYERPQTDSTQEPHAASGSMQNGVPVHEGKKAAGSLLLEKRSLVLITDDLYSNYLHRIAERKEDIVTEDIWNSDKCTGRRIRDVLERSTRVSLTIRNVPKVTYLLNKKK